MSRRQQRRRTSRRRAHIAVASGGLAAVASLGTGAVAHAATTVTVSNLNDSGTGSLRDAITQVNADAGDTSAPGDSIVFAAGLSGTISLTSGALPYITRPVQIVGPGASLVTVRQTTANMGIFGADAALAISGLTLTGGNNATGYGGAVYELGTSVEVDNAVISGNTAKKGGGIWCAYGQVTITNSTVSGNTATLDGGGVNSYKSNLLVRNSTFNGNTATNYGGGISGYLGTTTVTDTTVTSNSAKDAAGVVSYRGNGQLTGDTIAGNIPTGAGSQGGQVTQGGLGDTLALQDTIVSGSGATPDVVLYAGSSGLASFSLIRNSSAPSGDTTVSLDATDVTGLDPQLAPLAFNGGPTETMVPLPSSPVLDRGNAEGLSADQRGLPRPFVLPTAPFVPPGGDRSDIGSVEVETPAIGAIAPTSGNQGTSVGIVGIGFTGATQVLFGNVPASSVQVLNDGAIRAVAPAGVGTEDVRVITPLGESPVAGADKFAFPAYSASVSRSHATRHGNRVNTGIKVSCPVGGLNCSGSWKATATVKHHKTKLASGSINLAAGHRKTITFKLGSKAMKQLKSKGRLKITVHFVVADGNGAPVVVNRTFTLKYKKH